MHITQSTNTGSYSEVRVKLGEMICVTEWINVSSLVGVVESVWSLVMVALAESLYRDSRGGAFRRRRNNNLRYLLGGGCVRMGIGNVAVVVGVRQVHVRRIITERVCGNRLSSVLDLQ